MMKYWLILNYKQVGPFTSEQMSQVDFNAMTPVWHEGLPDWIQAGDVEELRAIISQREMARMNHFNQAAPSAEPENVEQPVEQTVEISVEQSEEPVENRPVEQVAYNTESQWQQPAQPQRHVSSIATTESRPSNYLVWAILVTIFCNIVMGVIAIIFASKVNTSFDRGDIIGARRNSDRAQWFIIFAIVLGVIWSPFQVALAML